MASDLQPRRSHLKTVELMKEGREEGRGVHETHPSQDAIAELEAVPHHGGPFLLS